MSRIVAGRFDRSIDADATLAEMPREGFRSGEYESFYVPPPGQHGKMPLGGDSHSDAGSRKAGFGAATGALIGAAIGGAAGAVTAGEFGVIAIFLGAGLGAYIGSFAGTMSKLRDPKKREGTIEHPAEPHGGRMVAINVDRPEMEPRALELLKRHGARDVGRAEGTWRDGSWRDFDPRSPLMNS
jgi:predicted lipid-binding transport protein (Tim44 family)